MVNNVHAPSDSIGNTTISFGSTDNNTFITSGLMGYVSSTNINTNDILISTPSHDLKSNDPLRQSTKGLQPQSNVVVTSKRRKRGSVNSKTKSKSTMDFPKPIVFIVPACMNIVKAIIDYGCKKDCNILVHHAYGAISEVNILNPLSPSNNLSLHGNFQMLSLSGFYTKSPSPKSPQNNIPYSQFSIQILRGNASKLLGGVVGEKLIAAEPVKVMAFIFKKYEYHKMVHPITNPRFEPIVKSTYANHYADNAPSVDITNHTVDYHNLSVGSSTFVNVQPPVGPSASTNVNMLHWNNPTNQYGNYI
ncbi:hypothetical protein Fmac_030747 [Flemingia macrophylla]|uniref:PPC domain-containing protein n=1 Tax=Flemingia macrophylla TaxID=520843 RepID=A0ABD1L046_9FABA